MRARRPRGRRLHERDRSPTRWRPAPARADAAAEARRARPARAPTPASRRPAASRPHEGPTRTPRALDPAPGGAALADRLRGGRSATAWRRTASGPSARCETAVASSHAASAASDSVTDAFMKVICIAPERPQRLRRRAPRSAAGTRRRAQLAERAARRRLRAGEPVELPPGDYPVVLEPHAVGELLRVARLLRVQRPRLRRGPRRPRAAGWASAWRRAAINLADSPRFARTLPRALRRGGRAQGAAAADPGRRGAPRGARHRAARPWPATQSTGHALAPGGSPVRRRAHQPRARRRRRAATRRSCARRSSAAST